LTRRLLLEPLVAGFSLSQGSLRIRREAAAV